MTWLTKIFNHVWSTEQIPEDWRKGIILPLWKRKGDALACSNHRGITLLSIPGKTFARVVINRAIPARHHHRRPHQAGFMPGRSTTDHISAIRLLAEKAREFRKDRIKPTCCAIKSSQRKVVDTKMKTVQTCDLGAPL